ncbi:MAG: hypothetical protein M3353_00180 [Actinomycetota bacterium]|nr:hypothetical protein [Actinomycetota bacterium]
MDMMSMGWPLAIAVILLAVVVGVFFVVFRRMGGRDAKRDHPVDPPR